MRPQWFGAVFIGGLLIYLSLYGLTGLGFLGLAGTPVDFTSWVEDDPHSRITVTSNTVTVTTLLRSEKGLVYKDFGVGHFSGPFDITVTAQITSSNAWQAFPFLTLTTQSGTQLQLFYYYGGIMGTDLDLYMTYGSKLGNCTITNGQHTFEIVRDSANKVKCVIDGGKTIWVYQDWQNPSQGTVAVPDAFQFVYAFKWMGDTAQVEPVSGVVSNLIIAGETPAPGQVGRLRFKAYDSNGLQTVGYVTCTSAPSGVTINSFDTLSTDWKDLGTYPVGSYTFQCTINGVSASDSPMTFTLDTAGKDVQFHAGSVPPNVPDFLQMLKDLFANPTFKTLELITGIGLIGIGCLMAFTGGRRYEASYRPPRPDYS
jgi:hypothetical protein